MDKQSEKQKYAVINQIWQAMFNFKKLHQLIITTHSTITNDLKLLSKNKPTTPRSLLRRDVPIVLVASRLRLECNNATKQVLHNIF